MIESPPQNPADRRPRRREGKRDRGAGAFLRDIVVIVVVAVVASFLIKTFLIRSFYIPSESMENTLQVERPDPRRTSWCPASSRCSAATSSCSRTRADGSSPTVAAPQDPLERDRGLGALAGRAVARRMRTTT